MRAHLLLLFVLLWLPASAKVASVNARFRWLHNRASSALLLQHMQTTSRRATYPQSAQSRFDVAEVQGVDVDGVALPFVQIDPRNQTLALQPTALHAISRLPAPVCALSVTGTARDGKSSWLNFYSHHLRSVWATGAPSEGGGFEVGHDFDTCTAGGWVRTFTGAQGEPLPGTDCASVVLFDTQGLAKGTADGIHRLFALSLLLSSTVILNVRRHPSARPRCRPAHPLNATRLTPPPHTTLERGGSAAGDAPVQ